MAAGMSKPLFLLSAPFQSGKTTCLGKLAVQARTADLKLAGILSHAVYQGSRKTRIEVEDLRTGARRILADRRQGDLIYPLLAPWRFHSSTLEWSNGVLGAIEACDLLLIDELGPLEWIEEGGFRAAFAALDANCYRWSVAVVRPSLLDMARQRWPLADSGAIERLETWLSEKGFPLCAQISATEKKTIMEVSK
jgi:nucleoside-triphosphatase THEP1